MPKGDNPASRKNLRRPQRGTPSLGSGRRPGQKNRIPTLLKEAIEQSFDEIGGVAWLVNLARKRPGDYVRLLAAILPRDLKVEAPDRLRLIDFSGKIPRELLAPEGQVLEAEFVPRDLSSEQMPVVARHVTEDRFRVVTRAQVSGRPTSSCRRMIARAFIDDDLDLQRQGTRPRRDHRL